ncbi:hypothetical protein FCV25MIE_27130 [Fagus crenata]
MSDQQNCTYDDLKLDLLTSLEQEDAVNLTLMGKLITTKNFPINVIKDIVTKAWSQMRSIEVDVKRLDRNIFMFKFKYEAHLQVVFRKRPWTIRGAHLILKEWKSDLSWQEVDFSTSTFWIQIHGLPGRWQDKNNLKKVGSRVGMVEEVDSNGDSRPGWQRFARVRVDINVDAPLKPGFFLPRPGLSDLWIGIKYEKIPDFCFNCGFIGHNFKECSITPKMIPNPFGKSFQAFGPWVQADNDEQPIGVYAKNSNETQGFQSPERVREIIPIAQESPAATSSDAPMLSKTNLIATCSQETIGRDAWVHGATEWTQKCTDTQETPVVIRHQPNQVTKSVPLQGQKAVVADETRQSQHDGSEGSLNSPGVMAFFDSETMPADTTLLPIGPSNDMGPIPLTVPMNGSVPTQGRVSKWKKAARNKIAANASPDPSKLSLNKKRRAEVEQGEDLNLDNPHVKRRLNRPSEDPDVSSLSVEAAGQPRRSQ